MLQRKVRWNFDKASIIKNTTKFKTNRIVTYVIKGVKAFLDNSKAL